MRRRREWRGRRRHEEESGVESSLGIRPSEIGRRVWEIGWGRSVPSGMYGICNY